MNKKIGLTLSGGGFRATVFHLGVMARLAELKKLEDVTFISTVSGGSLCAALVYAANDFCFPSSDEFRERVIPYARKILTTHNLEHGLIWKVLKAPLHILGTRANYLSELLRDNWQITARLDSIPEQPRWMINAACYETGKNWRFESFRMGDYEFGYTNDTNIPLSDAVAASCGIPAGVGALALKTAHSSWFKYKRPSVQQPDTLEAQVLGTDILPALEAPAAQKQRKTEKIDPKFPEVHLWDGGVYDIFGLEGLFDPDTGWRSGIEFMIVSDASGVPKQEEYKIGVNALMRIITGVMMPQVRNLRALQVMEFIKNHNGCGVFLPIGKTCAQAIGNSAHLNEVDQLSPLCLNANCADEAARTPTRIKRMTDDEFELLFRHGYEVACYGTYAHYSADYPFKSYADSSWGKTVYAQHIPDCAKNASK